MDKCFGCLPDISRGVGIGIAAGFGLLRWGWNEELQTENWSSVPFHKGLKEFHGF